MKKNKLPDFKSDKEFGQFVDSHDMAPYLDDMEPVDQMLLDPKLAQKIKERSKKRLITLRLPVWQVATAKKIAKRDNRPYQRVIQAWVDDGLRHEVRSANHAHR